MRKSQQYWLDHKLSRFIALLIGVAALMLAFTIHKSYNQTRTNYLEPTGNTEYDRCLEGRVAAIERMLAENVIDNQKAVLFQERAEALCISKFPPQ